MSFSRFEPQHASSEPCALTAHVIIHPAITCRHAPPGDPPGALQPQQTTLSVRADTAHECSTPAETWRNVALSLSFVGRSNVCGSPCAFCPRAGPVCASSIW
eukprot:2528172-Rhodomonas_salina.1